MELCTSGCARNCNRMVIKVRIEKLKGTTPVAARFKNADICNAFSGSDTTNIQLFCPNLLRNVANVLGHIKISPMTVLVRNSPSQTGVIPHSNK